MVSQSFLSPQPHNVGVEPDGRINGRKKLRQIDMQRLAEIEQLKIANAHEARLDFRYTGSVDLPAEDLKLRRQVFFHPSTLVSKLSHLWSNEIFVLRTHDGAQAKTKIIGQKLPFGSQMQTRRLRPRHE